MEKTPLQTLLESNELDSNLPDVPQNYVTTQTILNPTESSLNFHTQKLTEVSCGAQTEPKANLETYWNIRRYYINQARASARQEFLQKGKEQIQNRLKSTDINEIRQLFKERHEWRTQIHNFRSDNQPICSVENCPHVAICGSQFCINHITKDPNQHLYVECQHCHQPHPIFTNCFTCK